MTTLRWLRRYWFLLLFGFIGLGIAWVAHRTNLMHQRAKYTIGYITGYVYQPKSGKKYHYRYEVQGAAYEGTSSSEAHMNDQDGARFVVEYDSTSPDISTGHFTLAIPDSIRQVPANGWRRPPFPVPQQMLDRGKR